MSEFEYVSVAVALVYSFAVARILSAIPSVLAPGRRYWVHIIWTFVLLAAAISTWWTIWDFREVEWNPLRFMWVLTIPGLIYLRVGILVSESPTDIKSWQVRYYDTRILFFSVGLMIAANYAVLPWFLGVVPWFAPSVLHLAFVPLLAISVLGLASASPRLHGGLASANLLMILGSMAIQSR